MLTHATLDVADIKDGIFELMSEGSSLYLDSLDGPQYNGIYDDALMLRTMPSRRAKWQVSRIGKGYMIKQVSSGLYCALTDDARLVDQPVVLSCVPTVWRITNADKAAGTVRIAWSVSELYMQVTLNASQETVVKMTTEHASATVWRLRELRSAGSSDVEPPLVPGVYSILNKWSETYVSSTPDGRIGCWPRDAFTNRDTKIWEVSVLGEGYTMRLYNSNKYITSESGKVNGGRVLLSTIPAAWRIMPVESPVEGNSGWYRIYWADAKNAVWDVDEHKKKAPGSHVQIMDDDRFIPCRLFKFIS